MSNLNKTLSNDAISSTSAALVSALKTSELIAVQKGKDFNYQEETEKLIALWKTISKIVYREKFLPFPSTK